jgi:hypothetical protein
MQPRWWFSATARTTFTVASPAGRGNRPDRSCGAEPGDQAGACGVGRRRLAVRPRGGLARTDADAGQGGAAPGGRSWPDRDGLAFRPRLLANGPKRRGRAASWPGHTQAATPRVCQDGSKDGVDDADGGPRDQSSGEPRAVAVASVDQHRGYRRQWCARNRPVIPPEMAYRYRPGMATLKNQVVGGSDPQRGILGGTSWFCSQSRPNPRGRSASDSWSTRSRHSSMASRRSASALSARLAGRLSRHS